ncbi:MAG: hypothetical protein C4584_00635 [Armatimonadetes bacterium]|nr:MAG: hypothetical protein C4584_00635 [Armatimonadota bacterium]
MSKILYYKVLQEKVDPIKIAEDFLIQEFIKMFPDAPEDFYDQMRFYVRKFPQHYSLNRFWRLVSGISEDYMLKSLYRVLKGSQYNWSLEEVPIKELYIKMFDGVLGQILRTVDYNAAKGGEILRKMPPEERLSILDPFKFNKDNYPIIVLEEAGKLIVHDGNRRTLDAAAFGMPTIKAYIGRLKKEAGKPAVHEGFFTILTHLIKDKEEISDEFISCLTGLLTEFKKTYLDAPEIIDEYIPRHILPQLKSEKQKRIIEKVLKIVVPSQSL